jgi:ribosomal protein S18 acetylase RimI-like enzyme
MQACLFSSGGALQIRTFVWDKDWPPVQQLWSGAGPGIQLSPSDSPEEVRKKLDRDPDLFLVAEINGQVVGTVLGGFDGRRGMVYHLVVRHEWRRRGIGKGLMQELEMRLQAKGCLKYYLLVTRANQPAIEFYRRLGWEDMDLTIMGKRLR